MTTSLQAPQAALGAPPRPASDAIAPGRSFGTAADALTSAALWQEVLADLERDPAISRASFATWLRATQLLDAQGSEFTVGAQHTFALDKLERSFRGAIERALDRRTGQTGARVRFVVARTANAPRTPAAVPRPLPLKTGEDEERTAGPAPAEAAKDESSGSYPVDL